MATKATGKKKTKKKSTKIGARNRDKSGLNANQQAFLKHFPEIGSISRVAKVVGINRLTHFKWMKSNMEYKRRFEEALELYNQIDAEKVLEEVNKRAYDGWDEETVVEEIDAVVIKTVEGDKTTEKIETVPKKMKRTKVHRFSIPALLWKANFRHGNPQRLEVNDRGVTIENPDAGIQVNLYIPDNKRD